MRLALFQPDIPQNVGAALRLGACLDVPIDVIAPCGFPLPARAEAHPEMKRAGMDYLAAADLTRHDDWDAFCAHPHRGGGRLILLTTKASITHLEASFSAGDTLLLGRESAGAPENVHARADLRIRIPMAPGTRSLNLVTAAALVLAEGLRQTGAWARLA